MWFTTLSAHKQILIVGLLTNKTNISFRWSPVIYIFKEAPQVSLRYHRVWESLAYHSVSQHVVSGTAVSPDNLYKCKFLAQYPTFFWVINSGHGTQHYVLLGNSRSFCCMLKFETHWWGTIRTLSIYLIYCLKNISWLCHSLWELPRKDQAICFHCERAASETLFNMGVLASFLYSINY